MSGDDEISKRLIEGDTYDQATVTVRRTFDIPLDRKIRIAAGALATSVLIAPAVLVRREFVRSLEPEVESSGPFSPSIGIFALLGIAMAFAAGLLLVRQKRVVVNRTLSEEAARRLVRIEDLLMWFVLSGAAFVAISTGFALTGLLAPGAVETLYEYGVVVYRPSQAIQIDVRLVSLTGGASAAILFALSKTNPSREES